MTPPPPLQPDGAGGSGAGSGSGAGGGSTRGIAGGAAAGAGSGSGGGGGVVVVVVVVDVVVDVEVVVAAWRADALASTLSAGEESPPLKRTAENDAPAMATTRPPPTNAVRSLIGRIPTPSDCRASRHCNRLLNVAP